MKVSVVMPTLNAGPLLKEVLEAVRRQEFDGQVELVIADSMSDDGTAELAQKYADVFFQVPRAEFNHGETRNLAVSKSGGELVSLLVQDATPADNKWLQRLADNFRDAKVAGAYSRQLPRPDCYPLIRLRLQGWSAGMTERRVQEKSGKDISGLTPAEIVGLYGFDNVSSMVRRSVWDEVKFRRRKFAEDVGWAKDVIDRGCKIVYEPESVVIHSHNKPMWYEFKRIYLDHQNWRQTGGFQVFNRLREVFGASVKGTGIAWSGLRSLGISGLLLFYWSAYAPFFVFSQNLAQYMGGWADRRREKYSWYEKVDRFLSKGV
jgi:rhamnosyltransferase